MGKNIGPTYNEIANIPLFIWDPRFSQSKVFQEPKIFDLKNDPEMNHCIEDAELEKKLRDSLAEVLRLNAAPDEIFNRYHL